MAGGREAEAAGAIFEGRGPESQQEGFLSFAFATLRAGAWDLDLDTYSATRSAAHDRIFGYPELLPAWTYDMFLEHVVPEDRAQVDQAFRRAIDTGDGWSLECRIKRVDGPIRRIWVSGRPIAARVAGERHMSGIVQDITARRETEEALRASEALARARLVELEAIYETAPIGLCVFDEQLRWTRLNRIIAEINGRAIEEHIGRTPGEIVPDVGAQAEEALRTILRTGERLDFEMRGTTAAQPGIERVWSEHWVPMKEPAGFWRSHFDDVMRTGEHRTVDVEFDSPVFGHQYLSVLLVPERTAPFSILAITRDITPLKKVEQSLRESEAALREADRHKNEFLAWLSHELRNPFNVVRGSLSLMNQTGLESEQSKRVLPGLNRQVALMGRLLDDLLDVTRISKGKIRLQPERTALAELVRAIGEDHREAFDRQGIHFDVVVPGEPLDANVDRARITQVVGNLLQNAAKFTPSAGHMSLSLTKSAEGQAIIEVRDDGAGIAPDLLGRLFEPHVQEERTISRSQGGLGLGLALVKGLVALHGGAVTVSSGGPGRGSTFTVRLPTLRRT
jgi:PAS domain S-box-containing protein